MGNDPPLHSVVSEICTDWKYFTVRFKLSNYGLTVLFTIQPQRFSDSRKEFIFSQRCLEAN